MSEQTSRPSSQKSRQELLDELYFVQDVAGEREQRIRELGAALDQTRGTLEAVLGSRSWRLTAPLRAVARWLGAVVRGRRIPAAVRARPASKWQAARVTPSPCIGDAARQSAETGRARPNVAGRRAGTRCLYVDVSELAAREGRTGVQRVVREILRALLASPPEGFTVEPVRAEPGQPWRYARAFAAKLVSGTVASAPDATIEVRAGDVFLGLDHAMQTVIDHVETIAQMRTQGARVWFVCNDTLPLSRPEWFPPDVHQTFKQWFETIARVADGIACISQTTEDEVRRWIDTLGIQREPPLALRHFQLGADLDPDASRAALTPEQQATLDRLRGMSTFLMVGTLEPRKGHAQALEAFNLLWEQGSDVALVIVGLPGWMTEVVQRRIRHHDEFGTRLFWFMGASDAMLEGLYSTCTALLAPSEGEGFGLPLIEAARRGLPILCRELPAFREVAGEHAMYFSGLEAGELVDAIRGWMGVYRTGILPSSAEIPQVTWAQSAMGLLSVALDGRQLANRRKAGTSARS